MDLKSIHEIFTNRILRIPSYQRGYSWSNNKPVSETKASELKNIKGQLMDLWNDTINIPDGSWHYTGLLTLVKVENPEYTWLKQYEQFAIVDGQQRITSILILIAVIVNEAEKLKMELGLREDDTKFQYLYLSKDELNAYIFGYDHDNPSDKYFRKHILGLDEIEDDSKESVYTENLKQARAFFETMVHRELKQATNKKAQLQVLFDRVTNNLRLNEYILPPELDEYVVFETMNNRGKPLSQLEKLKNRLMYLSDKFPFNTSDGSADSQAHSNAQKKDLIDSINRGWITIYQALGANKQEPLDDDEFIKGHWIAYFDRYNRKEANAYGTHLFSEHFTLERVYDDSLQPSEIRNYVKSLQRSAVVWNKIHNPDYFSADEGQYQKAVRGLQRVDFRASFKPLVLAILQENNRADFVALINFLEQYAFKLFHISDRQSNTGDSKLYRLASKVYHSEISAYDAHKDVDEHIDYYYSFSLFKNQMQALFDSGKQNGYYEWSGLHYFLYEYDQTLRSNNSNSTLASELVWQDFIKNTVEHIYPQSAAGSYEEFADKKESPQRREAYDLLQNDWSAFKDYKPGQRKRLCNSLGNLLAISHSANASLGNERFSYKVDQSIKGDGYKNRGYRYDSMSAQMVAKEPDWTPDSIKERGLLMLNAMLAMLDEPEDLLDENEALTLLGLEFMIEVDDQPVKLND